MVSGDVNDSLIYVMFICCVYLGVCCTTTHTRKVNQHSCACERVCLRMVVRAFWKARLKSQWVILFERLFLITTIFNTFCAERSCTNTIIEISGLAIAFHICIICTLENTIQTLCVHNF